MNVQLVNVVLYFQKSPLFVMPFFLEKSNTVAVARSFLTREEKWPIWTDSMTRLFCKRRQTRYLTNGPNSSRRQRHDF